MNAQPPQRGLYDPRYEHDACGIGFVARRSGVASHEILTLALTAVGNMAHRGGVAADGKSGDGAGVLTQIPRAFFGRELAQRGISYPIDQLAVGMCFLPQAEPALNMARAAFEAGVATYGMRVLAWRAVPINHDALGESARSTCPTIEQALIGWEGDRPATVVQRERALYLARKQVEATIAAQQIEGFSIPSLSSQTIIYKGLLVAPVLPEFYTDLRDPLYQTAIAVFHQRYSTNTFPTWPLAQPFRMLSHNGEINTVWGNVTWMQAREAEWRRAPSHASPDAAISEGGRALAEATVQLAPVVDTRGSDSAMLDNTLELMVLGGRDVRHALTMLAPEAWEQVADMDPSWRAFYQYHAGLMEPWDGPAALCFSDGTVVGLALDRNGLRPARYLLTDDGLVVVGSEVGAVEIDDARVIRKGKVGPGQMIAVDLATGEFQDNTMIKGWLASRQPYAEWLAAQQILAPANAPYFAEDHEPESSAARAAKSPLLGEKQRAFGYTSEELTVVLRPMLRDGQEPVGSMGDDTSLALFSIHNRPLYGYFKQRFAEVTNPPIDPLREALVMSLSFALGRRGNLLEESPRHARLLRVSSPVLTDEHLATIRAHSDPAFSSATLRATFPVDRGAQGLEQGLKRLCADAEAAVADDKVILILSDRGVDEANAPIPALLALGAVHQHLIRKGLRTAVSLVIESGEPREVHHLACLIGMGAEAVNPYLALASVRALAVEREEVRGRAAAEAAASEPADTRTPAELANEAEHNYIHALEKGLLKVMSKMGIATVDSYCGAQIFEVIGLSRQVTDTYFTGVPSRLGGIDLRRIARAVLTNHEEAFSNRPPHVATRTSLPHPGFYKFKKDGEHHSFEPKVIHALQRAAKADSSYELYKAYSRLIHSRPPTELRDLLALQHGGLTPIDVGEVEPIEAIARRFSTAAMSHGSTSLEAHETLSIAMNRIGGMANSGEGGEDPARYGTERNSAIKQVASGRFGVTPAYLASAKELQIKMAQGSKPGEGGQIPGVKVTEEIARNRYTVPGVSLISPPPHHDIYSIEDLAQLIYDLRQVNPAAAISVKLVAEAGVGTIAAGVAKGGADVIHMSGHSGGTGASPLSSIKNAGVNWELGLAETQQTLVLNNLRGRVRVRVDGGLKTGRDVVYAAILGADEFSFGTAALVAEGCVMARACHLNSCPVGIATQRPELRAKFTGLPEDVVHFFLHVAQEVRELLAELGARTLDEVIGHTELLAQLHIDDEERRDANALDMKPLLERVGAPDAPIRNTDAWNGRVEVSDLNTRILADADPALQHGRSVDLHYRITNVDRSAATTLSGAIGGQRGAAGLPEGAVTLRFSGSAGQSFGAFLAPGIRMLLEGESNDYVGKGMGGGEIVVRPSPRVRYAWHKSSIIGNTCIYGATGGALFAAGRAGERFGVRNSGAVAVVEGVGDHGCEYMTGGVVLVLGATGRNFAAGMTGGLAYVFDPEGALSSHCNTEMVQLGRLDAQDEENVRALLIRHLEVTSSPHAADLLRSWETARGQFVRVKPRGDAPIPLPATLIRLREQVISGK
jgi:glutamate synthase (ferredoxin)